MYIRYLATVDDSRVGQLALEYLPSLLRIAPVRVMDPRGPVLAGASGMGLDLPGNWAKYDKLFTTPMDGTFVNVVCTDPNRWSWSRTIEAPTEDLSAGALAKGAKVTTEKITGTFELYTQGVRNVLIPPWAPQTAAQANAALKYEAFIAGVDYYAFVQGMRGWVQGMPVPPVDWDAICNDTRRFCYVATPVADHRTLRQAVLGTP